MPREATVLASEGNPSHRCLRQRGVLGAALLSADGFQDSSLYLVPTSEWIALLKRSQVPLWVLETVVAVRWRH